jgi:hypothetical protein
VQTPERRSVWRRPGVWVLLALPVHGLLFWGLSRAPDAVETLYGGLYPAFTWLRRWLDLTLLSPAITIGAGVLVGCGVAARRGAETRRAAWAGFAWRLLVALAVLVHLFPPCWGLNYLRPSAAERLGLDLSVDQAAYSVSAGKIVEATDAARIEWGTPDHAALERAVDAAVLDMLAAYDLDEAAFSTRVRFLPAGVMLVGGWHGVTIPHTTEAWVDPAVDPRDLPHVIAHEKVHQAGFARESDANFLAWLALTRSDHPHLRYSALFFVLDLFAAAAPAPPAGDVQQDLQDAAQTVEQVRVDVVAETTHDVYDTYLKANTVEEGVADYDRVAEAIHAWLQAYPDWLTR